MAIEFTEGMYFITFTCQHWLPLFELTNSYNSVYKWFDYLQAKGHNVKGYVIMPNHLHALIDFGVSEKSINTIVSNGKRFIAYKIVERLKEQNNQKYFCNYQKPLLYLIRKKAKFIRYLKDHLIVRK